MKTNTVAQVYVGTYAKYNSGSIEGAWLDCEDYNSKEEFLEACAELHKDESDPEFMYQDYEGFPKDYYSESDISSDLWDEFLLADADEREAFKIFIEQVSGSGATYDSFQKSYKGWYRTEEDFTYQLVDDLGYIDQMPEHLKNYFDYEAFSRDLFLCDYTFVEGHVFSNY